MIFTWYCFVEWSGRNLWMLVPRKPLWCITCGEAFFCVMDKSFANEVWILSHFLANYKLLFVSGWPVPFYLWALWTGNTKIYFGVRGQHQTMECIGTGLTPWFCESNGPYQNFRKAANPRTPRTANFLLSTKFGADNAEKFSSTVNSLSTDGPLFCPKMLKSKLACIRSAHKTTFQSLPCYTACLITNSPKSKDFHLLLLVRIKWDPPVFSNSRNAERFLPLLCGGKVPLKIRSKLGRFVFSSRHSSCSHSSSHFWKCCP